MNHTLCPLIFLVSVIMCLMSCQQHHEDVMEHQPNIVFILADDLRADAIGAYDNPIIKTPHIDEIIHGGYSFMNAYCMGSHHGAVCAPSRSMMLTGKTLHHVYADLDTVDILPQFLQQKGYTTFATGKYHTDFYERTSRDFKGWDVGSHVMFGGMSDHNKVPIQDQITYDSFTTKRIEGFSSEIFTDAAVEFITQYESAEDGPFYAYVAYTAPHDPRTPPDDFMEMYQGQDMQLPANFKPIHPFHTGWMTGRDEILTGWPREESVIKDQLAEYYGLISHMDQQIGRITAALKESGQYENTIIIFAADHGLAMGSHGLLGKQSLYEHSMKAPLAIMGPGIPADASSDAFVYLLDIFGTIMDFAGVDRSLHRESLVLSDAWKTSEFEGREYLFTTYEDIQRAVRVGDWKLIRYTKIHHNQLFNLAEDPHELNNLAEDKQYEEKLNELWQVMQAAQEKYDDPHPLTSAKKESMVFDPTGFVRKVDRHQPDWVVKKYFD